MVLGVPAFIAVYVWPFFTYNRVKPAIKSGIGFALEETRAFLVENY